MATLKCRFVLFGSWEHVAMVTVIPFFLVDVCFEAHGFELQQMVSIKCHRRCVCVCVCVFVNGEE